MKLALTRAVSPTIDRCELTHLKRVGIDLARARRQHRLYEQKLEELGCHLISLPALAEYADAVFVEDVAVVFDELAIATRPGAVSRRGEVSSVARELVRYRRVETILAPGLLDGGDVLVVGKQVFVGLSRRSNAAAVAQLQEHLSDHGYHVAGMPVGECLHLKTAACRLTDDTVLLNPSWVDAAWFVGLRVVEIVAAEPMAANVLAIDGRVLVPAHHPATARRLGNEGFWVEEVEADELAKAEAGVTCCSLIFESEAPPRDR